MYAAKTIRRCAALLLAAAMLCVSIGCEKAEYDWNAAE